MDTWHRFGVSSLTKTVVAAGLSACMLVGGLPTPALAEMADEVVETQVEQGQADALNAKAAEVAKALEGEQDAIAALWDLLCAVEVTGDGEQSAADVDALAALAGEPSTARGVTRAFVAVAGALGADVREDEADDETPRARIVIGGADYVVDAVSGVVGEYPWMQKEETPEEASAETPEEAPDADASKDAATQTPTADQRPAVADEGKQSQGEQAANESEQAEASTAGVPALEVQKDLDLEVQQSTAMSGVMGTCSWSIDSAGTLTIKPQSGSVGTLPSNTVSGDDDPTSFWPWAMRSEVKRIKIQGTVRCSGSMAAMFAWLTLDGADLRGLDTSGVTGMQSLFAHTNAPSLDLSMFNTSNVTDMGGMFYDSGVRRVNLSSFDTRKVEDMSNMFFYTPLESFDITHFRTPNLKHAMFFIENPGLKTLDLSNFDTRKVEGNYMSICMEYSNLTTLKLGANVDTRCMRALPKAANSTGKWWSWKAQGWFSEDQIRANRSRIADTYTATASYDLSKAKITGVASVYCYTGGVIKPKPTVTIGSTKLKEGTHYTLSYSNANPKNGKVTITVKGKGSAKGTRTVAYRINKPQVTYRTHVQGIGDQKWMTDGQLSGTAGQSKRLEGIWIKLGNKPVSGSIRYRTHVQKIGDQPWRSEGQMSGTSHQSKRLESIQIELTGEMAKRYDVFYRVHAQKFGWMGWAKNGARSGTAGYSRRLEAIQIVLLPKGSKAPSANYGGYKQMTAAPFARR